MKLPHTNLSESGARSPLAVVGAALALGVGLAKWLGRKAGSRAR